MSRGLGRRQRLLLGALAELEEQQGEGWYHVAGVLNQAWELGLDAEVAERRAAKDAEWEAEKAARRQWLSDLEARVAAGDEEAGRTLKAERDRDVMLSLLGAALRRRRRDHLGAPRWRAEGADLETTLNPSRCLALLEQRGLVERDASRGWGSSVALTSAGREVARQCLATARPASS